MARGVWVRDGNINALNAAKPRIARVCEQFIADVLKPRFLPEILPSTEFNFPVDIVGKWHGTNYRFMTRYKCGGKNRTADGFDAPFARFEGRGSDLFDVSWHRHTGQWHPMFQGLTLKEALDMIESVPTLQPVC